MVLLIEALNGSSAVNIGSSTLNGPSAIATIVVVSSLIGPSATAVVVESVELADTVRPNVVVAVNTANVNRDFVFIFFCYLSLVKLFSNNI